MNCEFDIIKKYFLPLTKGCKASNALQDDVALISLSPKKELVISKDLMAEDIHFKKSDGAYNIASKLLKTNLSDLAASGAKPLYYLLGFSQNIDLDENFVKEFCRALKDVSDEFGIVLIGGDSIRTENKLCFSLTIFGEVAKGKSLKRSKAKAGDLVFVSGNIGDAFLGLQLLQEKIICPNKTHYKYLTNRHLQPSPRIRLGIELIKQNCQSAIDISDGFLADLKHICQAANLDAIINQSAIPLSAAARSCLGKNISLNQLLSGGDDYELIFCVNKKDRQKIVNLAKKIGVKLTCVGYLQKPQDKPKVCLLDKNGGEVKILQYGWQHY
ncbi:MAG: thiamine-phosphate kinase [Pseudomonadota bacterium]